MIILIMKIFFVQFFWVFSGDSELKASACNEGDLGLIPGSGRSPGERNGNPLQYSCLENPMDEGAWWATVHGGTVRHNWATSLLLRSITMNKASGGDGIPGELFQILEDDAVRVLHSICQQFWKLISGHGTRKGQFSFQSQRKGMPNNAQTTAQLHSSHMLAK